MTWLRPSLLVALSSVMAVAGQSLAAQPNAALSIGDESFGQSEILDARGLPSIDGMPVIMVTFDDAAARKIQALTQKYLNQPMAIAINGKLVSAPVVKAPVTENVIEISGVGSMEEAVTLAKTISGKDPLPDSLEEGGD
jgi:preprotein translocase subunit SecD